MLFIVVLIVSIWEVVPKLWFWWCMQRICMASGSMREFGEFCGVFGLSYVIVSTAKWAITCEFGNDPSYGVLL